jgi:hypothetical protein
MLVSGRAAGSKMKSARALSLLTSIVLLGAAAKFNETPAHAQGPVLDDIAPTAQMTANSQLSATDNAPTGNTAGTSMRAPVAAQGREEENDVAPRRVAAQTKPALMNPLWRLPLERLSTTRERPIFSLSRRPPAPTYVAPVAVQPPAKPPEPDLPAIALVGTIIGTDDGYRMAIFRDTSTQDVVHLHMGENYQGWEVRLINQREAGLVKNGEQAVLELPAPGALPPPPRSRRQAELDAILQVGAE